MLTDVPGFLVGHHTLTEAETGCTVILCPTGTVAGVQVSGGWPGSRDLPILEPTNASPGIDAIVFSGRSVFGLGVADGVIQWVHEHRKSLPDASPFVPQVPAAVINDLPVGDTSQYTTREHGYLAAGDAAKEFERGSVGAGIGGSVGRRFGGQERTKGGVGSASITFGETGVVAALAVVNSFGIVLDENAQALAGPWTADGRNVDPLQVVRRNPMFPEVSMETEQTHTTLVAVATNAGLTKTACSVVARMAQAGMASAIRPVFAPPDGDIIIVASAGEGAASEAAIGTLASHVVAASIRDAVRRANNLTTGAE